MKDFPELVQRLSLALKALAMYTGTHPRAQAAMVSATEYLHNWLADAPSVHLATSGGRMFLDGAPFEGQSVHMTGLARILGERQISGLIFTRGVTAQELEATLGLLILKPSRIEEKGGPLRAMAELGLTHVEMGQVQYREVRESEAGTEEAAPAIRPVTLARGSSAMPNPEVRGTSGQPSMETLRSLVEHWRQAFRNVMDGMDGARTPGDPHGSGRGAGGGEGTGDGFRASTGIALEIAPPSPRFGGPGREEGAGQGLGGPGLGQGLGGLGAGQGLGGPGSGQGWGGPGAGQGLGGPGAGQGIGGPGAGQGTGGPGAGQGLGGPGAGSGPGGPGTGENTEPGSGGLAGQDGSGAGQGAEGSGQGGPASGHPGGQPDLPPGGGIEGLPSGPADLSVLGATMAGAAIGEGMPEAQSLDALRRALHELPPGALLSVVEGLDSLPRNPAGLRMAFTALSPEAFARATAAFLGRGAGRDHRWPQMRDRLHGILQGAADGSPAGPAANLLSALEAELRNRGLGLENIKELVALLEWDKMALDDQIRALEERNNLWALSHQQRLAFLRRILDDGREDTFRRILAQVLQGLESPDPNRREAAARTLVGVAHWLSVPGLPPASEADLLRGLQAHFMAETLPQVHKATVEAFAVAFAQMLARSEPGRAHAMLVDLDRAAAGAADPMRREAMAWLWDRMGQPEALARVFELLHTANPESLLTELIPYLETVGAPAARQLVWVLGEEQDRKRRVRLVEIIRGLGHLALPAMHEALESDRWYLVRNTLNILADLGDADALRPAEACLTHPDGRVRRAAVRTVWKLGGPQAVPALMTAFHQADAETLLEIMFAFGQIRATAAVSLLGVFAQDARMPEKLRARAAETLGLIGGAPAMAILEELLKRKGRIFTTAEPTEVRAGAAKGLASLGTPQAMASLLALVEREPRNADRPIFQEILDQARR